MISLLLQVIERGFQNRNCAFALYFLAILYQTLDGGDYRIDNSGCVCDCGVRLVDRVS
jgi:hypothetical protein